MQYVQRMCGFMRWSYLEDGFLAGSGTLRDSVEKVKRLWQRPAFIDMTLPLTYIRNMIHRCACATYLATVRGTGKISMVQTQLII